MAEPIVGCSSHTAGIFVAFWHQGELDDELHKARSTDGRLRRFRRFHTRELSCPTGRKRGREEERSPEEFRTFSANLELPQKPSLTAMAQRQQIRDLHALGSLFRTRRRQECYLVHQSCLLAP